MAFFYVYLGNDLLAGQPGCRCEVSLPPRAICCCSSSDASSLSLSPLAFFFKSFFIQFECECFLFDRNPDHCFSLSSVETVLLLPFSPSRGHCGQPQWLLAAAATAECWTGACSALCPPSSPQNTPPPQPPLLRSADVSAVEALRRSARSPARPWRHDEPGAATSSG